MIGRTRFVTGPEALVSGVVALAMGVMFYVIATEPVDPVAAAPVQVVSQK